MKSFGRWFADQISPQAPEPVAPDEAELPDGLWRDSSGTLTYECRHCESKREWYGEPEEFDIYNHIQCGGSPFCLP